MPYLFQVENNAFFMLGNMFVVGRSSQCSLFIDNITISLKHCIFTTHHNHWFITDMSRIGVFINGNKIKKNCEVYLKPNDNIQMGCYMFLYTEKKYQLGIPSLIYKPLIVNCTRNNLPSEIEQEHNLRCIICLELFIRAATLNCQHVFCDSCIFIWHKESKTCPICRTEIKVIIPYSRFM